MSFGWTIFPGTIFHRPSRAASRARLTAKAILGVLIFISLASGQQISTSGQGSPYERTFSQPRMKVEKALKELQTSLSGRLPTLDGFAVQGSHPLTRYQRGYYQSSVQVTPAASGGGSVVRVSTKVTAWYADSSSARSGYQLLTSNGRLENDLLDQLSDLLGNKSGEAPGDVARNSSETSGLEPGAPATKSAPDPGTLNTKKSKSDVARNADDQMISAPAPRSSDASRVFLSPPPSGLSSQQLGQTKGAPNTPADRSTTALQEEASSLEEVLKNQAHPKNLVAVKKSGTPVVSTPSLNAKTLFLATAQDEFEMLDFNADWVHVRISGLSRGWIWRTGLEMPEGISDVPKSADSGTRAMADLFQISREETAPFPGDWEPLRGKNVKIISVQKIHENDKESGGAQAKLEYAKSLLDKNYAAIATKGAELSGIVLIFDSADGGMIAATVSTVKAWRAGTLSDAALWHQCYFDPPETFTVSSAPGTAQ
jgi:hypothetical protein